MLAHKVRLRNGTELPAIGQGTWYLGENRACRARELSGLRQGIEAGMTLIDTAEMYGNGDAEELVGEALRGLDRSKLYLVSKVLPGNAGGSRMRHALTGSLSRMGITELDLYLYHWRGQYPLAETVGKLEELRREGLIRGWGVSNFDISDMEELWEIPEGRHCLVNQVLYHTGSRGIEFSLLPWMREHEVTLMSYCPLAQAGSLRKGLFENEVLREIAAAHQASVAELLLAWNIRDGHTIAIPRSSRPEHTLQNAASDRLVLSEEELHAIDRAFPAPARKLYLDMQ